MTKSIFVLILSIQFVLPGFAQEKDSLSSFLARQKKTIVNPDGKDWQFDKAFYNNQYFFFGETHGSSKPQEIDYGLFTHLHQKAGVKFYIAEIDCSKAFFLNRYLASGDTTLLDKVFASWKRDTAQWANKEHYNKWLRLKQYQRSLEPNKRFSVIGVDVPQDNALLNEHVLSITNSLKFGAFQNYIDSLERFAALPDRKELVAYSKRFKPVLDGNRPFFSGVLKQQLPDFDHLITSLTYLGAGNSRDKVMYLNLTHQLSAKGLEKEKMYGFLGFYHCLQTGYNKSMPFAALIKERQPSPTMVSLVMLALDSKTMLPYTGMLQQMIPRAQVEKLWQEHPQFAASGKYIPYLMSNDSPMMGVAGIELLRNLSEPNSVNLFRLDGEGSPFKQTKQLAEIGGFQPVKMSRPDDHALNAFQYIILFRNSREASPL